MKQNTDNPSFSPLLDATGYDPIEDRLRADVRATIEAIFKGELAYVVLTKGIPLFGDL